MDVTDDRVTELADEIRCSPGLARDLLVLAGGDVDLVRQASEECDRLESMKALIIDRRFKKFE